MQTDLKLLNVFDNTFLPALILEAKDEARQDFFYEIDELKAKCA